MSKDNVVVLEQLKDREQQDEMARMVNRANATNYARKYPEAVKVADLGTYTLGLTDTCNMELLSIEEGYHIELIDQLTTSFVDSNEMAKWIKSNCRNVDELVTASVKLETPLKDGTDVVYIGVFRNKTFQPVLIAQWIRRPKYWVMVATSEEQLTEDYVNKAYLELADS